MPEFKERLNKHIEHIKNVGPHCSTEETTKQALILPFLDIIDFSPFDPTKVKAEYCADLPGIKNNERVDYALFSDGNPVMFVEAKAFTEKITNHTGQLARYFNATPGVAVAAITNGREWRFFTDLKNPNIMDDAPFLVVDLTTLSENHIEQLSRFRHDNFQPDKLKTFAEERVYLNIFQTVIESCLRDPDADFVRFVATRAELAPKLTSKFIDTITPIVKQSVAEAISRMVVSGLSAPPPVAQQIADTNFNPAIPSLDGDQVDPNNPKIITTIAERQVLSIIQTMLEGQVPTEEIVGKDTESYYTVLYQGKVNRWILRYVGDRAKPLVYFNGMITDDYKAQVANRGLEFGPGESIVLPKPEYLIKLSGLVNNALVYCQDDANFKREKDSKKSSE
ncbi:MAG: type I restriction endonuclease [Geobacteraceae bacterium]|nr:type I restriction endonuclease [Geobacteraceae bacterium]